MHEVMAGPQDSESDEDADDSSIGSVEDDPNAGRLADKEWVPEESRVQETDFLRWKDAFKIEMVACGKWRDIDAEDARPTGKALFTTGLLMKEHGSKTAANAEALPVGGDGVGWVGNKNVFADGADFDEEFDLED